MSSEDPKNEVAEKWVMRARRLWIAAIPIMTLLAQSFGFDFREVVPLVESSLDAAATFATAVVGALVLWRKLRPDTPTGPAKLTTLPKSVTKIVGFGGIVLLLGCASTPPEEIAKRWQIAAAAFAAAETGAVAFMDYCEAEPDAGCALDALERAAVNAAITIGRESIAEGRAAALAGEQDELEASEVLARTLAVLKRSTADLLAVMLARPSDSASNALVPRHRAHMRTLTAPTRELATQRILARLNVGVV